MSGRGAVFGILAGSLVYSALIFSHLRRPIPLPKGDPEKLERIMAAPEPSKLEHWRILSSGPVPADELPQAIEPPPPPVPRVHRHAPKIVLGRNGAPIIP